MVEQYLSAWLDQELAEINIGESLVEHCRKCDPCKERLSVYRDLNQQILSSRPSYPPIDEDEWSAVLGELQRQNHRQIRQIVVVLSIVILSAVVLAWVFLSKPEKIPNVYELQEGREN
jgi:hypothetical protein